MRWKVKYGSIMVKIITDSTCDLSSDLVKKYDIEVIPLYVNFGEETFKDGVEIDTPKLYEEVEKRKALPKTAAISALELEEAFRKWVDKGYEVVYTGISGQMSSTLQNAKIAAKEIGEDKVYPVDSKNLSTGISLLLLKACKDRDNGLSAKEIAANMEKNTEKVYTQFVIETMEYLHKGGRCSGIARFAATILRIKPIIQVRDGKMSVQQKPIGKTKIALDRMVDQIRQDKDRLDLDCIFITHSIAPESKAYLHDVLSKEFPGVPLYETTAGCVISSHCGKGCIGILYMVK